MEKTQIIQIFNQLFSATETVETVLLIGSFGRGTPKPNSNIDYQIIVKNTFDYQSFLELVKQHFGLQLQHSLYLTNKSKVCFYLFDRLLPVEIFICYARTEIDKFFLGSEIYEPQNAIVFDKSNTILSYLEGIIDKKKLHLQETTINKVKNLILGFQYHFQAASFSHFKSDGYKFFVVYTYALNYLVRLIYFCEGNVAHEYMPPNFLNQLSHQLKLDIEKLGLVDLQQANVHKRKLLDLFKKYLVVADQKFELGLQVNEIIRFLETVYKRDFLWNFRDVAKLNSKIKKNTIFRSSALCLVPDEELLLEIIKENNIKTIIDLRANKELNEHNYSEKMYSEVTIVHAPFDPWNQSIAFQNLQITGTNLEIAYNFFALDCKASVKKMVETIIKIEEGAICIHCFAGKDRTGFVITLLHLLIGTDAKIVQEDYLASEMNLNTDYLQIILQIIQNHGGVTEYLVSCGLTIAQINQLSNLLCK